MNRSDIKLQRGYYLKKDNKYIDEGALIISIPCGEIKHNQNKIRQKITSKYTSELQSSNLLLLDYENDNPNAFLETFTSPVLSRNSETENISRDKSSVVAFDDFLESDLSYMIYGKDKCGKTSLLKRVQLYLLKNYSTKGKVPLFIDYKELENKGGKFDIKRMLANYYEINNSDALEIVSEGRLLFLIDNYNPDSALHPLITKFLVENNQTRFIICSDDTLSRTVIGDFEEPDHQKLYFKNLTRTEIRLYTQKQSNIKQDEQDLLLERIEKLCIQLQLPINFWTVSLIRLIYKKSNDDYSKNLFSILDLCVDELLNKKILTLTKSSLKFEQYKDVCSHIAHYLLINHQESVYSATYEELIDFLGRYISEHTRIVANSRDIFDYLFNCGILKDKNNRYTFRLNGIFEYFLAYYLKDNHEFKTEILDNDYIYLQFKNELEIYSGFNRKDYEFVEKIFSKTKKVIKPISDKYIEQCTLDENLKMKLEMARDFSKNVKELKILSALDYQSQDAAYDKLTPLETESEVHLKEEIGPSDVLNYEVLDKYLEILARVFKNSDGLNDQNFINEVFTFLIDAYCVLGFYFIDKIEKMAVEKANNSSIEEEESDLLYGDEILNRIARIIPIVSQTSLYSGLGHTNLSKIILAKIDILCRSKKENQYRLFMLYFLLMDIDLKGNKNYVNDVFANITMPALKVSTYFKLSFYLAFKAYNNKDMEVFFKNKVQESFLRLDNKNDANSFQAPLSKKQRKRLINSNKAN